MSAPLVIPFNYDSGTTSRKSTAYTVGAGKYCWAVPYDCRATVNSNEIFLADAVTMVQATTGAVLINGTSKDFSGKVVVSASATNKEYGYVVNSSGTSSLIIVSSVGSGVGMTFYVRNGVIIDNIGMVSGSSENVGIYVKTTGATSTTIAVQSGLIYGAWYKAGDVLDDAYWLVTEYNSVT